jgi:hypothetical protein
MMMKAPIESLEAQVKARRNYESPPLHLWNPELSGDISIKIDRRGNWFHEGAIIERESLVRLFASILRREEDGEYYLVTPAEKWRIEVELHPLQLTDIDVLREGGEQVLQATLNTDKRIEVSEQNPLFLDPLAEGVAVLQLPHGLTALCTRSAWYRLVALAHSVDDELILNSGAFELRLPTT